VSHSHADHRHEHPAGLTRNQELVLGALNHADGPLSAYDILDRLREEGLRAPLQVYRALDRLVAEGLAHRLESLNAFVCCADTRAHGAPGGTTAFAICSECGRVDEFADPEVDDRLAGWAKAVGFAPTRTTIELRGRCCACRAAGQPA
jgi:Fur family zinc uptake transcriptional regulator